jgi:hypothetical protein
MKAHSNDGSIIPDSFEDRADRHHREYLGLVWDSCLYCTNVVVYCEKCLYGISLKTFMHKSFGFSEHF